MAKKKLPPFKSEAEEASWYQAHQDELEDYFEPVGSQHEQGKIGLGFTPNQAPPSKPITIRVSPDDIERAKKLASKKGIGYQTLLKMLIHEGLEKEESA